MRNPSASRRLAFLLPLFLVLLGCAGSSFCPDCSKATAVTAVAYPSSGSATSGATALTSTAGTAVSIQPTVTGGTPTSFLVIDGALPPGLALNPANGAITGIPTSAGVYTVTVQAGNKGGTSSTVLTITVLASPTASLTAARATLTSGDATTLVPTFADGTATLGTTGTGSTDLAGSAASGVPVATGALTSTTTFTLSVTNSAGARATATCTVTVVAAASASLAASTTNPLCAATGVTITPVFTGAVSATVGTTQGGSEISATPTSGTPIPIQATGFRTAASYWLRATNAAGGYTDASVTVTPQTVVLSGISPAGRIAGPGSAAYAVTVHGGATGAVTWSASGGSWSGSAWTSPATAGSYDITATSVDDPSVSLATTATVSAPVFTTQPLSSSACLNGSLSLTAAAAYATSYQWYKDGVAVDGAISPTYTVPTASYLFGTYTCRASNGAGTTGSDPASVAAGSAITAQPQPPDRQRHPDRYLLGGGHRPESPSATSGPGTAARSSGPLPAPTRPPPCPAATAAPSSPPRSPTPAARS